MADEFRLIVTQRSINNYRLYLLKNVKLLYLPFKRINLPFENK